MSGASNIATPSYGEKRDAESDLEPDRESFSSMSSINTAANSVQIGFGNKNDMNAWCTILNKQFLKLK
jgi:hypothetical protein